MNTHALPVSMEKLEFDIPCAIEGCDRTADFMIRGDHSVWGCPGEGFSCDFHRRATLAYAEAKAGSLGRCRCGGLRIESPENYRTIEL